MQPILLCYLSSLKYQALEVRAALALVTTALPRGAEDSLTDAFYPRDQFAHPAHFDNIPAEVCERALPEKYLIA